MKQKILYCLMLFFALGYSYAQQKRITGKVTTATDGSALPGVSISVTGTSIGTQTNANGNFSLEIPNNASGLEFRLLGFVRQSIKLNSGNFYEVSLAEDKSELQEVVVTGVAEGTSRAKLPFALTKVDAQKIGTVPALDLSQALYAKVAGITISQTQGDDGASVFLRGAKSMGGYVSPLIVVDGFVTDLGLSDLNPQDVESIEVVKGAAASALYGTRAEGGVIQVISKKGKLTEGNFRVTVDNEYGKNDIQRLPDLATMHPYQVDLDDEFGFVYASGSTTTRVFNYADNGFSMILSPYKNYYDNADALLGNNPFYRNSVALSTSADKYNAYLSFENQVTGGALVGLVKDNVRRTAKLNLQFRPLPKLEIETNLQYYYQEKPSAAISGNGQGTYFAATLQFEPFINLAETDASGNYLANPRGFDIQGSNLNNPLSEWSQRSYEYNTDRILAGGKIRYKFTDKLALDVLGSINKTNTTEYSLYPVGYVSRTASDTYNNGYMYMRNDPDQFINSQVQLAYNDKFGDFDFGAIAKFAYEYNWEKYFSVSGFNFSAPAYDIGNSLAGNLSASGSLDFDEKTVNYGYFLNLRTSYKDKFFIDALARIDQSSRYGADEQTAFFPRIATAYRITQDYDLGAINELKARVSYGKAGSLPDYGYKESRATVSSSGLSISQNENTALKRSITSEWELGFDATVWNRLSLQFNYALAKSEGDIVQPPSFTPYLGSSSVYRNFGVTKSNSIELEANGNVLNKEKFSWDAGLTFGRTRSKIKELGEGLPPYASDNGGGDGIGSLYWKDVDISPWAFYGNKVLTSLDELQVVDGIVVNAAGGTHALSDFVVNDFGYVVLSENLGTASELPLLLQNEAGTAINTIIGDAQPNFKMGFNSTFTFNKRLSLYLTLDWQNGGQKYNQTAQYLTFDDRSGLWQQYAAAGLPYNFMQTLYNGNSYTSAWVEDSDYLTLRELSIAYTFPKIGNIKIIEDLRVAITGRNLYTWTKFTGSNPEGYFEYFPYPVYRTYTAKLTVNF